MSPFLILFVIVDAIISATVLAIVLGRRNSRRAATPANEPREAFGRSDMPATPGTAPTASTPDAGGATRSFTRLFGGGRLRGLATFSAEQHDRIGNYVRGNWSGVPDQLPAVLSALVSDLEHEAQARGLSFDRETLKSMLAVSLSSHRIGNGHDVLEALEKVA
jgi:hypothetical protein